MRLLAALLPLLSLASGAKILVYSPSISTSHIISNARIADTLAAAGHDVVVFIPEYMTGASAFNGAKKAKVVHMKGISSRFEDELTGGEEDWMAVDRLGFSERLMFENCLSHMCDEIMKRKDELEDLKNYGFDAAFAEQVDLCGIGVIRYLGIKNLFWISTTPIMDAVSYNLGSMLQNLQPQLLSFSGIPAPVSYVPTIEENDNGDKMDFWQRAFNLYMYVGSIVVHRMGTDMSTEVFRRHVGEDFPNIREIAANSSLCFVNADEMFDLPRPIIHKNIYVGGLGVQKPKPLDKKYTEIMSKGKEGVIVFSLGSIAQFHALEISRKLAVVSMIRHFRQFHFVVKVAKDDTTSIKFFEGVPNVNLVGWMPQSDLLAHPRLKLFMMHGGLNGLTEAMLRGVPVTVTPIFADQFRNGRNVEKRGVGRVILKKQLNKEILISTVEEMMSNPSYKKNALRMQSLMLEKPFSPEERLVKWTEFAVNHGVLEELHVEGSRMNTIVYFNLDVFAALFLVIFTTIYIVFRLISCLFCSKSVPRKVKVN